MCVYTVYIHVHTHIVCTMCMNIRSCIHVYINIYIYMIYIYIFESMCSPLESEAQGRGTRKYVRCSLTEHDKLKTLARFSLDMLGQCRKRYQTWSLKNTTKSTLCSIQLKYARLSSKTPNKKTTLCKACKNTMSCRLCSVEPKYAWLRRWKH